MPLSKYLVSGPEGSSKLIIPGPGGSTSEVFLHGAHVTSWIASDGRERMFLSSRTEFGHGAAIRGGVPVIFPQFAGQGPIVKHGFARNLPWEPIEASDGRARLRLRQNEATLAHWPYAFEAEVLVVLDSDCLSVSLSVLNTSPEAFHFTSALHTYLRVDDIAEAAVEGLQGVRLQDSAAGNQERIETEAQVRFHGEVDRIYFDAPETLILRDGSRITEIRSSGFADAVVWNPGPILSAKLKDMEPEGYRRFVCVESAAIGKPIALQPGQHWTGTQTLVIPPTGIAR